jgi:hypothetical protein
LGTYVHAQRRQLLDKSSTGWVIPYATNEPCGSRQHGGDGCNVGGTSPATAGNPRWVVSRVPKRATEPDDNVLHQIADNTKYRSRRTAEGGRVSAFLFS